MPGLMCDQMVCAESKLFASSPEKTTADRVYVVRWRRIPQAASMLEQQVL